jgi:hypothetical protein
MAAIESKRSVPTAQPRAHQPRKKHSATNPQPSGPNHRSPKKASFKKPRKREKVPASLRFTETKRGKTTIRRYPGRTFHRFHEVKGKTVDFVEVFICADYNCVDVRFDDKTSMNFVIEPAFTLETEHADWKTGNWRPIKKWPLIHSESHRT